MDPNNSRPMSYDSLKILLQYAKPNLRFELSRRIPSIRLTEKAVPLRIDKLTIGSLGVEVNDIKYEAHTIRHFPPNLVVSKHLLYESHEGDWDLDEWGFDDYSSETVFTPGDLVLQVEGQEPRRKKQDEEYRKSIELDSNFKTWLHAQGSKESSSSVKMKKSKSDNRLDSPNLCKSSNLTKAGITPNLKSLIHPKQMIEDAEVRLAPFKCLEDNIPLPFTKMVQVVIRSKNETMCWRYAGSLKHYEIRKQLMTWLFGNRKPVIQVNHLTVHNGIIARLPENLRISVKTLRTETLPSDRIPVDTNTMLNKLEAIIHHNNLTLDVFETDSLEEDFGHPMATNAKKLIVSNGWSDFPNASRLIRVSNQKFHISSSGSFEPDDIILLIRDWIESPREIGKCFSLEESEWSVRGAMIEIQTNFEGIKTENSIEIPVNNSSQISVSYGAMEIRDWGIKLRLLTIEVVAA